MRSVALATAVVLPLAGCRVFDESFLERDGGSDRDADAGSDAARDGGSADASSDAGPTCPLSRPPARPLALDAPSVEEAWYALEGVDLDQSEGAWATTGYDLDGLCSEAPDPVVECRAPASTATPEIDGRGGIDNAIGHLILPLLLLARPDIASDARDDQHEGLSAFILGLRRWNGTRTDPLVDAMLAISEYGTPALPDGGAPPGLPDGSTQIKGDGGLPPPAWEGTDYWWVRADNFLSGDPERPLIRDQNAYVADGLLVMRLPDGVPLILTGGKRSVLFRLTDAVLTARLSDDFTGVEEALIAGRFPVVDMLETIVTSGICVGTEDYERFSRLVDLAADIRATPGTGGPGATCDALSIGLRMFGTRANFGGVSDLFGVPDKCAELMMADGGVDGGLDAGVDAGS